MSLPEKQAIRLVVADVDGTLVTREKVLTPRARSAVQKMSEAGIKFALTSGRPPRGMQMLIDPLSLTTPLAAFNGGMFVRPDLSLIEQRALERPTCEAVIALLKEANLVVWVYRQNEWFVPDRHGPHVDREEWTVKFPPTVVPDMSPYLDGVAKIVGVSDDVAAITACEKRAQEHFSSAASSGQQVSAARSQPYYLDITHPEANKGAVVLRLSAMLGVPPAQIATIGDMPNDISMFKQSGFSIAMGQSSDEVKGAATAITASVEEEGFAEAMEKFILGS